MSLEYAITLGLSVFGNGDRFYLRLAKGLNETSLNAEQASELRAELDVWLYEYWQLSVADREMM